MQKQLSEIQKHLIQVLIKHGPLTRDELTEITKIARTTIYEHLEGLLKIEKVNKFKKVLPAHTKGRRPIMWVITEA